MEEAQLSPILEACGLAGAAVQPLESADNHVFRLETAAGQGFVLRIGHGFDPLEEAVDHVRTESAWLEHIRGTTDLVVPRPVPQPDGRPCGTLEIAGRSRVFALFAWIEGELASGFLDPASVRRMGRAIARLHTGSRAFAPPLELCRARWDQATFFGPDSWLGSGRADADLEPPRSRLVREVSRRVRDAMDGLGRDRDVYGLIHSDTHPGNMLVADGDVAIIDFNDCGWGHYALDLGVMLFDLPFMLEDASACAALREAVLAGYQDVAPLPVRNGAGLDAFVALRGLTSLAWIARSRDPEQRRRALATRPGMPLIWQALERF